MVGECGVDLSKDPLFALALLLLLPAFLIQNIPAGAASLSLLDPAYGKAIKEQA